MCHNLTVLSMDEDSRKKFWIDRAKIKQDETEERTTTALFTLHNSSSGQESGGQRVITLPYMTGQQRECLHYTTLHQLAWPLYSVSNVLYQELTGEMTQEMLPGPLHFTMSSKNKKKKTGSCCSCCLPSLAVALLTPLQQAIKHTAVLEVLKAVVSGCTSIWGGGGQKNSRYPYDWAKIV